MSTDGIGVPSGLIFGVAFLFFLVVGVILGYFENRRNTKTCADGGHQWEPYEDGDDTGGYGYRCVNCKRIF